MIRLGLMVATIIDTHPVFMGGLSYLLKDAFPGIKVNRSAGLDAFSKNESTDTPDFMILGVNAFFEKDEIEHILSIKAQLPSTKIIIFYDEITMILPLLKMDFHGFLAKKNDMDGFKECIELILDNNKCLDDELLTWMVRSTS